jgi:hypothetical protein
MMLAKPKDPVVGSPTYEYEHEKEIREEMETPAKTAYKEAA